MTARTVNRVNRASVLFAAIALTATGVAQRSSPPDWPAATNETRPWTRWWWLGSAVDPAGLSTELESLRAAGLGGVEITPIYGVVGAEDRFVPYLSDQWMRRLDHTLREARRLDLGVDMATGTGWPFGGPWIGERDACRALAYARWQVDGGERLTEPVRLIQSRLSRTIPNVRPAIEQARDETPLPLQALMAYSSSGEILDLTTRVRSDGTLDWIAPGGRWTLYGVFLGWHGKKVERAAPGGEGDVIDHFSRPPIRAYLARFDRAFAGQATRGLRAFFNDSYEVDDAEGQADATATLFDEFARRRGYDLRRHLPALFGEDRGDSSTRIVADYRQTISELLLDTFTTEWRGWAARHGAIVRNQAHGSPANLLDLYAASDIPETEGSEIARFKWASSAAHVAGRRLVSAEAATWLGEHFRSALSDVRSAVDRFFVAGVNHIVYHGTAYSPPGEPWPGWLFYASVEFNPRNSWWADFSALNQYVTRVQSFLQSGRPDHDVLLYYPFYESIAVGDGPRLLHFGGANPPPGGTTFEEAAEALQRRGYTYDFVSDRQVASLRVVDRKLMTGGGRYKVLVVPATRFIPLETLDAIARLVRAGAPVVSFKGLPEDVAGYGDLERRRERFRASRSALRSVLNGDDLDRLLAEANVSRETLVDRGVQFARRAYDGGRYYFLANDTDRDIEGWLPFDDTSPNAVVFDPITGRRGDADTRRGREGALEVRLAIPRRGSAIVATTATRLGERLQLTEAAGPPVVVRGPWRVRFVAGGPELPAERSTDQPAAWTTFSGDDVKRFSGTAVYSTTLTRPATDAAAWRLDLGGVHDSARVRVNGRDVGTSIGPVFQLTLEPSQLAPTNTLEIHVSNLMANRIAALDKAGVRWRKFYNVNFPARLPENRGPDGLFSAAKWEPLASGLDGPVTLTPLAIWRER